MRTDTALTRPRHTVTRVVLLLCLLYVDVTVKLFRLTVTLCTTTFRFVSCIVECERWTRRENTGVKQAINQMGTQIPIESIRDCKTICLIIPLCIRFDAEVDRGCIFYYDPTLTSVDKKGVTQYVLNRACVESTIAPTSGTVTSAVAIFLKIRQGSELPQR